MIKFLSLKQKLNSIVPALCLFGNDSWLKSRALSLICEIFGVQDDGFGIEYLESPTAKDIVASALTPSMFGSVKMVVVNGFNFPLGKQQQETKEKLSQLFNSWDGSFCVIFDADSCKIFEDIEKVETIDCNKLDRVSIAKWIVAYCRRQNIVVDNAAASKLADYCLYDMSRISRETQKLVDYGKVDMQSIDALVYKDAEYVIYDLTNVISSKNAQKAIEMYKGLLAQGEDNRALFGFMYNFYRRVFYVKVSSDFTPEQIAESLGVKRSAVGFASDIANKYKPLQLKRALDFFCDADRRLKAFDDENEVMTTLIVKLTTI